jgi:pimeloyl-ACP methyl ester carboxylesterase
VSAERFFLFGYAGGAQFAHRYAMAHPHRVAGAVVASAGQYTPPDPTRRFPRGTRASARLPGVSFDPEEFLRVPITVIADAKSGGAKRPRRRRRRSEEQEQEQEQGRTRAERARDWVAAMQAAARAHGLEPAISYEELADCEHSFLRAMLRSGLGERLFEVVTTAKKPASPRS